MWRLSGIILLLNVSLYAAVVCNAGFPGENSAQILRQMPQALAACPNPVAIVVFVGMNDAANGKRLLTPEQTCENVLAILQASKSAGAESLLVTIHQPDRKRLMQRHKAAEYGGRTPDRRVEDANQALRAAARETHSRVVNFNRVLAKAGGADPSLSTDGVHLTEEGYRLLAKAVEQKLPKKDRHGRILCLGDSLTYGIGVRLPDAPDAGSLSYPQQLQTMLNKNL